MHSVIDFLMPLNLKDMNIVSIKRRRIVMKYFQVFKLVMTEEVMTEFPGEGFW